MNCKVIRFRRKGRRFLYRFDIVVSYRLNRARGAFVEKIGFFDLVGGRREFNISTSRLGYWLNRGALLHPTVRKYLAKFVVKKYNGCNKLF